MERRDAIGAVVIRGDGQVLVVRRGRAPGKGTWTIPGGKVEPGETLVDAVVREVREETGLAVRVVAPLTVVPLEREGFSYAIHEHLCAVESTAAARPGDDADEVQWVSPSALEALGVDAEARSVIALGLARRTAW